MSKKGLFERAGKSFVRWGVFFLLSMLFTGGSILPAYAKEGGDNRTISKVIVSENGQTVVEETFTSEDGKEVCDTTESLPGVEDNLKALKEIPFSYNTNTADITFTRVKEWYYILQCSYNGDEFYTCCTFYSGWDEEYTSNVEFILCNSGSYTYRMYAFTDKESMKDISKAVAKSKDISFKYTKPDKALSKAKLTLEIKNNELWVTWDRVGHAYQYAVEATSDQGGFVYYNDDNNSLNLKSFFFNTGVKYQVYVRALPENVNEYYHSESDKSEYFSVDENGKFTIESQPGVVEPNGIGLNYDSLTLQKGETRKVTATVTPDNAKDKTVKWVTGNSAVATVDQNGNVKAVAAGATTLSATTSNGISKSIPVKVIVNPTSISLNKTSATIYFGETLALTPTLVPSDVTEKTITWTSSNTDVATVNNGKVKAKNKGGTTTITAKTANGLTAACNITVLADNTPGNIFADIKADSWMYKPAKAVYEKGYMTGKGMLEGRVIFDPNSNMDRSQFVTALYSMDGKSAVMYVQKFSDVKESAWYAKAVTWASNNGIVAGNPDGTFGVNGKATREQMALMFYKYAVYKGYDVSVKASTSLDGYSDAKKVDSWALTAIKWAVERGIISGKGNASTGFQIDPIGKATRVECAAMMNKFSEVYAGAPKMGIEDIEEPLALPEEETWDVPVPGDETEDVIIDEEDTEDEDASPEDGKDAEAEETDSEEETAADIEE